LPDQFTERLSLFSENTEGTQHQSLLTLLQRGIERECLRINPEGKLAQTPHPEQLGSPLTHPNITTDFSEALLELITPVSNSIDETIDCLDKVHRAVYPHLGNEELWSASMPCVVADEDSIPVAQYGKSNVAQMKTTYRKGLGHRYGRLMQTIAGIHYNFSLPDAMWTVLQKQDYDKRPLQDYKTDAYFQQIRNFRRSSWLLIYLYGASPAVCESFIKGRDHQLERFDKGSFYLPQGTSLRMGGLGYQSNAQENLNICYNSLDNYISTLQCAITNNHPDYEKIGLQSNGEYQQLSTALLQIENEFYSTIRPKRVTASGEIPLAALKNSGVEYIEVRCIDVNPYLPLGIDEDQIRFLDCFLLYCLFKRSPLCDDNDRQRISDNQQSVVNRGRDPDLVLSTASGDRKLQDWGSEILNDVEKIAMQLDAAHGGNDYQRVCAEQRQKIADPELTPSARILADMRKQQTPFFGFAIDLSRKHGDRFRNNPLNDEEQSYFHTQKEQSEKKQQSIEESDTESFKDFLTDYHRQYENL
jgi:glutamate--cysteine ligase